MNTQWLHTVTMATTWHHRAATPSGETLLYFSTPLAKTNPLLFFHLFFVSGKIGRKDKRKMFAQVRVVTSDWLSQPLEHTQTDKLKLAGMCEVLRHVRGMWDHTNMTYALENTHNHALKNRKVCGMRSRTDKNMHEITRFLRTHGRNTHAMHS